MRYPCALLGLRFVMTTKNLLCLGIESSCDETSAAIVGRSREILSHIIYSQIPEHQKYGGVVPELAARAYFGDR